MCAISPTATHRFTTLALSRHTQTQSQRNTRREDTDTRARALASVARIAFLAITRLPKQPRDWTNKMTTSSTTYGLVSAPREIDD